MASSTQAWEVSPAEVRSLKTERVTGGTKVTLPEFGLTAAVVFTADNGPTGVLVRFQSQAKRLERLAAQWCHDLAEEELRKVTQVETQLEQAGHALPDSQALLKNARKRLEAAVDNWNNCNYREAYAEAERSMRPLRILMRGPVGGSHQGTRRPGCQPVRGQFLHATAALAIHEPDRAGRTRRQRPA